MNNQKQQGLIDLNAPNAHAPAPKASGTTKEPFLASQDKKAAASVFTCNIMCHHFNGGNLRSEFHPPIVFPGMKTAEAKKEGREHLVWL